MKILSVSKNNRRHVLEVRTRNGSYVFPYSRLHPEPSSKDQLVSVIVDPELGREGFTYVLESGSEGSVHIDEVLEYNSDPAYLAEMLIYKLTAEARKRFTAKDVSVREIARRLNTSAPQVYRLLDTTNYNKSFQQIVALLNVLGCEVLVEVRDSYTALKAPPSMRASRAQASKRPAKSRASKGRNVRSSPAVIVKVRGRKEGRPVRDRKAAG